MLTFIMLTRLSPEAVRSPKALEDLECQTMERVRKECPDVEWVRRTPYWDLAIIWIYSGPRMSRPRAKFRRWSAPLAMPTPRFGPRPTGIVSKKSCEVFEGRSGAPRQIRRILDQHVTCMRPILFPETC